jgi:hypothetical protein
VFLIFEIEKSICLFIWVFLEFEGEGSVLSSVIFSSFIKGNSSKLKQNVSSLVIKAPHAAKKACQRNPCGIKM